VAIVGEAALSDGDRRLLRFAEAFEGRFVNQGAQRRTITDTLDLAWELLADFPPEDLGRIDPALAARHRRP
jgi:V/A-type H+/Na+-transporting ATPase subunit B